MIAHLDNLRTVDEKAARPFLIDRDWLLGLLLLAATFLAYQPAWNGQPLWDDELHMTPPELRSLEGLARIWIQPRETVQYFPLAHTVFWLEALLWGDRPLGYHLVNILLHCFSAFLLVGILRRLRVPGAWLAAAVFALHPVMAESVAWISELKNALCGVFFLSAVLAYLMYAESGKKRPYLFALGLFVLGLLSKTGIATFSLAMAAALWWKKGSWSWKRDCKPLIPFFLTGIVFGLLTMYVERTHIGTKGTGYEFSGIERCLIAGRALWFYLSKVFFPVNLVISYPRWVLNVGVWWQYLFPISAIAAGYFLWAKRKVWRAPAAALGYFTAMLLPYLGFLSLFAFRYSFVADHYQYLAAIGPIVLGAGLTDKAATLIKGYMKFSKPIIMLFLLSILAMMTWKQAGMYRDAETLYRRTIARNGASWMAYNNLGLLLSNKGLNDDAIAHYTKALEINPSYAEPHNNLGLLLADMGRTDEAFAHYQRALEINPNYGGAHFNVGLLFAKLGRPEEALAHYQKALELNPNHAKTHNNVGLLLATMGRPDEAAAHYRKALEINPRFAEVHYNLGLLLANRGQDDEAMAHLLKALEGNPNLAEAHNIAGVILAKARRFDEAMAHLLKALEINPNNGDAQYNMGLLRAQMGLSK